MQIEDKHINHDLLIRFLADELTKEQSAMVMDWLNHSEENRQLFDKIESTWIEAGKLSPPPVAVEKRIAWEKVKSRIDNPDKIKKPESSKDLPGHTFYINFRRIAAAILILIAAYFAADQFLFKPEEKLNLSFDEATFDNILPDESIVDLNKNASLTFDKNFKGKTRTVSLEGEAFFKVRRDEAKPFIIKTGIAEIRVLGTSFNVKAVPGTQKVEVFVESGRVRISDLNAEDQKISTLELGPGEMGILDKNEKIFSKQLIQDHNKLFWKTKTLVFNNAGMPLILSTLEQYFGARFDVINPDVLKCHLDVSFENEDLEYILEVIAATASLSFEEINGVYKVNGKACE